MESVTNDQDRNLKQEPEEDKAHTLEGAEEQPQVQELSVEEIQAQLEKAQAEAAQWLDKYRRALADFANYRKRIERERTEAELRMRMDLVRKLLPIKDDFQRALQNIPAEHADSPWVQGVVLIENKLHKLLEEADVVPIEALGKPFDPNYHEAVMEEQSKDYPPGVVMEEVRKGYLMGKKLLRPTMVKVSKGPGPEEAQEDPEPGK